MPSYSNLINVYLEVYSRAFYYTKNGTQYFVTTVIDDYLYLLNPNNNETIRLGDGDFYFVSVRVDRYTENRPLIENNNFLGTYLVPNINRTPLNIYVGRGTSEWEVDHVLIPGNHQNLSTRIFSQSLGNVTGIKVTHDNGLYDVEFTVAFSIRLKPSEDVIRFIEDLEYVYIRNRAYLNVRDSSKMKINRQNQNDSAYLRLDRNATTTSNFNLLIRGWDTNVISQPAYSRIQIPYRLVFQKNTSRRFPDEIFKGLLQEQRSSMFYNLLPPGTILDTERITVRDVNSNVLNDYEFSLHQYYNWQGSGRTLVVIRILLGEDRDENFRNVATITNNMTLTNNSPPHLSLGGTGFSVDFYVFYPWMNIRFFGNQLRNIASYQSRNGRLPNGHTNFINNSSSLTAQERNWMSRFPNTDHLYLDEINTMSAANIINDLNPVTVDQLGFSIHVRASSDLNYSQNTVVVSDETYFYRLQFIPENNTEVTELTICKILL